MKSNTPKRRTGSSAQKSKQPEDSQKLPTQGDGSQEEEEPYEDDFKELYGTALNLLLGPLKEGTICLFPGRNARSAEDVPTCWDCLPRLGDCTILIFCELNLTLNVIRRDVEADVERNGVRVLVRNDHELPGLDKNVIFPKCRESSPDWIPQSEKPNMNRFWHHCALLEVQTRGNGPKTITLLHLGIGGQAVWLYFLNPHELKVKRIIIDPRGGQDENGGVGQLKASADNLPPKVGPEVAQTTVRGASSDSPKPRDASGYDRDLFEMVLSGITESPKRLKTILLWRGFLARQDAGRVFLCTGSADGDVEMLQRDGLRVQRIDGNPDNSAEILDTHSITDEVLYGVFTHPPIHGLSGLYDFGRIVSHGWPTFRNCKFGVKVPVEALEPGIALLVKVLPLLGLHTVESCDGHLIEPPRIRFISKHHWNWARLVLPVFTGNCGDFARGWGFHLQHYLGEETGVWLLGQDGCGTSVKNRFTLYSAIQRLAANIMEGGRASRLRAGKGRVPSPERLERAADLRRKAVEHLDM